jgi:hypothetical protein
MDSDRPRRILAIVRQNVEGVELDIVLMRPEYSALKSATPSTPRIYIALLQKITNSHSQ